MSRILFDSFDTSSISTIETDQRDLYKSIILRQSLPPGFDRSRESGWSKKLACIGESDNNIGGLFGKANFLGETPLPDDGQDRSAIQQARDSMFFDSAEQQYLTRLGDNFGVPRPPQSPFDDELYRQIGQILAWLPKTPLLVTYRLAEAIFGTQSEVEALFNYPWQIYEVIPNEIIFECPVRLIAGNPTIASYLHGYPGSLNAAVLGTTVTFTGSDVRLSADTVVGLTIYILISGTWTAFTIASATFLSGTNTLVLGAAIAAGNYQFYIDIPGSHSFLGDFMLSDASVASGGTNVPSSLAVYLYGQGRLDIFTFYMNNFIRAAGVSLRVEVI